ncbi:HPF/RaiA family ribosome-associated protein [Treponema endosymbiont of Eucomonympha sp.]|uniref:HPF/RaiA family ribosome-associated protein n=1 Tax=Treponema endosymbiont of Eucomonympha sp. TaxID=1580831 RepID=UPI001EE73494|nr:HPF/RaiA family ribosome-associated protein [Treponema endosymbiont of Eucomonympha sp.]
MEKKLKRTKYAEERLVDLTLCIKRDKKFVFECTLNFRWGASAHIENDDYDFAAGLSKLLDVLDQKVKKENDKMQEKK